MRVSEAALALFMRSNSSGETQYLTQWNHKWQAFSLIGGHRRPSETPRACCLREVEEELGLVREVDFNVAPEPLGPRFEYEAISHSAGVETHYRFDLFSAEICTAQATKRINSAAANCWVTGGEVRSRMTSSGRPIAEQVFRVLEHFSWRTNP